MTTDRPGAQLARRPGLVARDLGDEVIVMDTSSKQVYRLEGEDAQTWRSVERGDRSGPSDNAVQRLASIGLLANKSMSRRTMLRAGVIAGGAAVALPAIDSIMAPAAFAACSASQVAQVVFTSFSCSTAGNGQSAHVLTINFFIVGFTANTAVSVSVAGQTNGFSKTATLTPTSDCVKVTGSVAFNDNKTIAADRYTLTATQGTVPPRSATSTTATLAAC